jgi:hypothetical protein
VEEELYLPLYRSFISRSCDHYLPLKSMGYVTGNRLMSNW